MLPDIGASELILIAVVALIVVGPKDLPLLMRKVGQFMARLRGMAAEFRASFDEMARQSELDELRKEVEAMRRGQLLEGVAEATSDQPVRDVISDIEQSLADSGGQFHPPMGHQFPSSIEEAAPAEPVAAPKPARKPRAKAKAPAAEAASAPVKRTRSKPAAKPAAKSVAKAAAGEAAAPPKPKRAAKAGAKA